MPTILAKERVVHTYMISTPLVCNGFGVLSTPPFLQCIHYLNIYSNQIICLAMLHNFSPSRRVMKGGIWQTITQPLLVELHRYDQL